MKHSRRTHTLVTAVVAACALLITLAPFGGYAGAQKTVPTKDGGQTTTEPDNSYGEGRTKDPPKKNVTPKEENSKQGPVEETPKQETLKQSVPRTIPTSLQETATAPLAGIPRGKRPILLLTENGQVVGKIVGPKGATDWEGFWGPNGGYVYFTKNGKEIPKTRVNFLGNINDLHFSPTGRFTRLPPIPAPPGANDVEMSWEDDRIVEAWWTRDGQRIERIPLSADAQEFHCQLRPERGQQPTQGTAKAQLVGLVYSEDSRPNEETSVRIVTDPESYAHIPALRVIKMQVPASASGQAPPNNAQATLSGLVVDLGDGRGQPADQTCTIQIPQGAVNIPVRVSRVGDPTPVATANVPLQQERPAQTTAQTGSPGDFQTQPVWANINPVQSIQGPLSGDARLTRIMVDNRPATIVAETPRAVYFSPPPDLPAGPHECVLQDGTRGASFPVTMMSLNLSTNKPELMKGETADLDVTLNASIPQQVWPHGGVSPGMTDVAYLNGLGINAPKAGEPGVVWLRIENASRQTISMSPSENGVYLVRLNQQALRNGQTTYHGKIHANERGGFTINGLAVAFFAPISGQGVPGPSQPPVKPGEPDVTTVHLLTGINCAISDIRFLKKWPLNVPQPQLAVKYIGQYHNWTPGVADDFEVDIEKSGEEFEPEEGDTFDTAGKKPVTRYVFKGKNIPHCSYATVHIPENPSSARVSWTNKGDVIGVTAGIPSHTVFAPPKGTEAFKPPEGANDFHIESKDEIAGFWAKDGVKVSLNDNPKDDYRYKVDVSGINGNFSEYWIHFVKATLQGRYKWWWTKDGKQIGEPGEG